MPALHSHAGPALYIVIQKFGSEYVADAHIEEAAARVVHQGVFALERQLEMGREVDVETSAEVSTEAGGMAVAAIVPVVERHAREGIDAETVGQTEGELHVDRNLEARLPLVAEHISDFRSDADMFGKRILEIDIGVASVIISGVTAGDTEGHLPFLGRSRGRSRHGQQTDKCNED